MADAKMLKKVPVREQDPKVRATNFEEVCLGYNQEEAYPGYLLIHYPLYPRSGLFLYRQNPQYVRFCHTLRILSYVSFFMKFIRICENAHISSQGVLLLTELYIA